MPKFTINVPAGQAKRIADAYAARFGYRDEVPNPDFDPDQPESEDNPRTIPNPQSREEFVKDQIVRQIKDVVAEHEQNAAMRQACEQAREAAYNIDIT